MSEIVDENEWGPKVRSAPATSATTLAAQAYEAIRADIIGGRLAPDSRLLTETIKERYGVGGSPMREALTRLAADGLLVNERHKGFRVVSASMGELVDVGRTRVHLELQALKDSIEHGAVDWEVRILSQFHRLQHALEDYTNDPAAYADQWETTHRGFHFALISACHSPWLLHFCDRIYDQTERYRRLYTNYKQIPKPLLSSHKDIMDAVLNRDSEKSVELLKDHIIFATRQTLRDMKKAGIQPSSNSEAAIKAFENDFGIE